MVIFDLIAHTLCDSSASGLSDSMGSDSRRSNCDSRSSNSDSRSSDSNGRSSNSNSGNCGRGDNVTRDANMGIGISIGIGFSIGFSFDKVKAGGSSNLW